MITVRNVTKSFVARAKKPSTRSPAGDAVDHRLSGSRFVAIKDLNLEARPGQVYGLLGPNGAGKTTMLRCIATLIKPDSGEISVMGHDTRQAPALVRANIGFLTSEMRLSGALSPRELLEFFGRLNHLDAARIKERTQVLAQYLNMEDFLDRSVEKLSTGQKQKTGIAVSLVHDPAVILFDEPTNGLDILAAKTVVDFLRDCKNQGKTVILSTHIMSEAEKLCDRIGIILQGEMAAEGTSAELCARTGQADLESAFFKLAQERGMQ